LQKLRRQRLLAQRRALVVAGLVLALGSVVAVVPSLAAAKGPPKRTLDVTLAGTGSGKVASDPAGIDCGTTCSADFKRRTTVTLTATPASDSTFDGWSGGGCSGTGACTIKLIDSTSVTATFTLKMYSLNVSISPTGGGTVTGTGGINCPTVCSATIAAGTTITLSASASSGYVFWHWSGDCTGTRCSFTMDGNKNVEADYAEGTGLCGADPQVKHSNGLGQYWFDCTALNTYNSVQAMSAAFAWNTSAVRTFGTCGSGATTHYVVAATDTVNSEAAVWEYAGPAVGHVYLNSSSTQAFCPSTSDPIWF